MRMIAPPTPTLIKRSSGVILFRYWRGHWYMLPWPTKRGPAKSPHQKRAQIEFGQAGHMSKFSTPQEWGSAKAFVTGSMYVPRDLLIRSMFGLLSEITLEDGTIIRGIREVAPDVQLVLDQLTTTAYAMVIRIPGPLGWRGIDPGTPGQVLTVAGDGSVDYADPAGAVASVFGRMGAVVAEIGDYDAIQISYDPSSSGLAATDVQGAVDELADEIAGVIAALPPDLQVALDALSSTPGAIIYRETGAWVALAPGTAGYALIAQSASPFLSWQTIATGGGGVPFNPPLASAFATLRNTPSLTDNPTKGLIVTGAAGSTVIRAGYHALGGDKIYTAHVTMLGLSNNVSAGIVFRDSAGGKCITFGPDFEGSAMKMQCTQWSSDTSAASNAWGAPFWQYGGAWLRATWHSVAKTIDLDVSADGVSWLRMQTANAFIANPNQVGFYMWSTNSGDFGAGKVYGLIDYWTEV